MIRVKVKGAFAYLLVLISNDFLENSVEQSVSSSIVDEVLLKFSTEAWNVI